jgi:hypothetical protein
LHLCKYHVHILFLLRHASRVCTLFVFPPVSSGGFSFFCLFGSAATHHTSIRLGNCVAYHSSHLLKPAKYIFARKHFRTNETVSAICRIGANACFADYLGEVYQHNPTL